MIYFGLRHFENINVFIMLRFKEIEKRALISISVFRIDIWLSKMYLFSNISYEFEKNDKVVVQFCSVAFYWVTIKELNEISI